MAHWIMPLYILTGIIMVIGMYLTIRYRPYCTLKSPEREIAMELHRKKLMNELMSRKEMDQNEIYKKNTNLHNFWAGVVAINSVMHIFILISMLGTELMIIKIIVGLIIFGEHGFLFGSTSNLPHCIKFFSLGGWSQSEQLKYLDGPNSYHKNRSLWSMIDPLEYSFQEVLLRMALLINIGLDIWLGLNGRLISPN